MKFEDDLFAVSVSALWVWWEVLSINHPLLMSQKRGQRIEKLNY